MSSSVASSSSSAPKIEARPSDQELVSQYNAMKQELANMATKVAELEQEREEHVLVMDTIKPLAADRQCWRLVGGVLVERTVGDVIPSVQGNLDGITGLLEALAMKYKKRGDEFADYQKKWNIKIAPPQ